MEEINPAVLTYIREATMQSQAYKYLTSVAGSYNLLLDPKKAPANAAIDVHPDDKVNGIIKISIGILVDGKAAWRFNDWFDNPHTDTDVDKWEMKVAGKLETLYTRIIIDMGVLALHTVYDNIRTNKTQVYAQPDRARIHQRNDAD